ncbi:MAG: hypothetical protein HON90_01990 [Halobacteriovoraceae bacterium]|jgi:hypothetical protein|nr:hypothetical protein [Halobacteriovoraceae bacterium]
MKKLAIFTLAVASISTFASSVMQDKNGFDVNMAVTGEYDITSMEFNIPMKVINDVVILGTIGMGSASTETGVYVTQYFDDGSVRSTSIEDGSADYLKLGLELRKELFQGSCLEGALMAQYNEKIGGSTEWGNWSQENDGEDFDPIGGFNVGAGINCTVGNSDKPVTVGVSYLVNESGEGNTFAKFRVNW